MIDYLIQAAIAIASLLVVFFGFRLFIYLQRQRYRRKAKNILLSIRVSRLNEKLPITAEHMFAALHGILHDISFLDRLKGVTVESFSFEIANVEGQIKFYAHIPAHLRHFLEGQLYAQYPDVEIEEVEDYLKERSAEIRTPEVSDAEIPETKDIQEAEKAPAHPVDFEKLDYFKHASGAELTLADPHIYPIKRHVQYEDRITRTAVDPISGITSAMMKLTSQNDIAAVQIIARPLGDWWRIKATKCARIIGKNIFFGIERFQKRYAWIFMTRKIWPRIVFFPFYTIFFFQGLMAGSKVKFNAQGEQGGNSSDDDVLETMSSKQHERESEMDAVMDKVVKLPFDCSARVLFISSNADKQTAAVKVRELAGSFKQFNLPHLNGFKISELGSREIVERFREREIYESFVLNIEELATVFHLPNVEVKTPNIYWVDSKKLEPPVDLPDPAKEGELTVLGKSNYRGMDKLFGIRQEDRRRHIYIIGKTGMGKSTLLENMILSDIQAGKGVAVVDPHGDLADHILDNIPSNRTNDVIVFDPSDREHPVAFNMLENIDPAMNSVVASGLLGIFKKLYADSWGPRLEHFLRNTILSLLEYPNTTMLGIPRILADKAFRKRVVKKITDPIVKRFWEDEFEKMHDRQITEAISPIQNKVGQFLSSSIIRNIVGQPKSMVDLRFAMDKKRIFVCNLSKGKIGEDNSSLLGSMIITKFQLDAMSRSNIPEKDRVDFYLYVDEFQNFATDSFATILSEARKYRLNLTMANQYIAQMPDEVRDAVFGNVGTLMSFQVGFDDAEYISNQFSETALPADLVQIPKYNLYTKLLIDGMPSQPFSAATLPPIAGKVEEGRREKVFRFSRERYAKKREVVEDKIRRWSEGPNLEGAKDEPAKEKSEVGSPTFATQSGASAGGQKSEVSKSQIPSNKPQTNLKPSASAKATAERQASKPANQKPVAQKKVEVKATPQKVPTPASNKNKTVHPSPASAAKPSASNLKQQSTQKPIASKPHPAKYLTDNQHKNTSSQKKVEAEPKNAQSPVQKMSATSSPKKLKPNSGYQLPKIKPRPAKPPVNTVKSKVSGVRAHGTDAGKNKPEAKKS